MNVSGPDVHQILEYRADTAIARLLPTGLGLCFLGLLGLALLDADRDSSGEFAKIVLATGICLIAGLGTIGLALWRRANRSRPVFVLSPMGVHFRIPWVKEFLIPWREIRGIDTIDITTSNWSYRNPGTFTFHNVTAILVPKPFYDARIFVDSLFLRGPSWGNNFIVKGDLVQVALHHELVSVEPRALRDAVEARWNAFRNQPRDDVPVKPKGTSVPAMRSGWRRAIRRSDAPPPGIAMGDNPKTFSVWDTVLIVLALIGIAVVASNLLGLWATQGQTKAHDARKEWEARSKQVQEERKTFEREQKERDQRFQELFRRM
ncbi:MAG TPA: hypothetical protein VJQ55_14280 [Candidatus Binatia bacterium]|nr:hypothetical protein [Candidatus Binatia bacterium]